MAAAEFWTIRTPRLTLVPVTEATPREVADAIGNYDVARWLGRVPYPYGEDDARAFIAANRNQAGRVWFIREGADLVGGIAIDGEFGYWLAREAWGRGLATEAGDAVVDVHFAAPGAGDLTALHYPGNDRSAGVLTKLGFEYTGRRPVQALALAQTVEAHELRLTRADWTARRQIRLDGDRVTLRPLREADWRRLAQIGGVPEVARMMLHLTVPWAEADVKSWIAQGRFRGRPGYRLGIEISGGQLIGTLGFGPDRSLSFMLDRRYWGKGYATEAARLFIDDLFRRFPDLDALEADHFTDNPASGRVLTKLGFEQTGTGLGASRARTSRAPVVLYRLSRGSWTPEV